MKRLSISLLVILAACSGGSATQKHDEPTPTPTKTADPTCPLEVPGTSVTVEDTANGAALVFVTTGDAATVRTRAQALAKRDSGDFAMMFPKEWTATEKDIEGGARVEYSGAKPEDAATVQSQLRMHAGHLSSGSCAM